MIASLKCQYAELLSDIGFIKGDLTSRKVERMAAKTGDGVFTATGKEVSMETSTVCFVIKRWYPYLCVFIEE